MKEINKRLNVLEQGTNQCDDHAKIKVRSMETPFLYEIKQTKRKMKASKRLMNNTDYGVGNVCMYRE
jgi:hypothetical protein